MRTSVQWFALASLALILLIGTTVAITGNDQAPVRDGVFIHVKTGLDDPHTVLMALQMAKLMQAERDVLVYFDVNGISAVVGDATNVTCEPFAPLHDALDALAAAEVPLLACPGCLRAAGKTPADLREGVSVARKDAFFSFTQGRILTLDS